MEEIKLKTYSTRSPKNINKKEALEEMKKMEDEIYELQRKFNANSNKSMLIILQWMDASGKDSWVNKVFSCMNPMGLWVKGFSAPNKEEQVHNFLWRISKETPEKWKIQIFNRSHYEDILVPSVEKTLPNKVIEKRYKHIKNFEKMLADEDTIILKFYLHMSKDKQKERLLERLTMKRKYFKFDPSDTRAREKRDEYIETYEKIFKETNTKNAPWYIIPADQKWYKSYLIMKKVKVALESLNQERPKLKTMCNG